MYLYKKTENYLISSKARIDDIEMLIDNFNYDSKMSEPELFDLVWSYDTSSVKLYEIEFAI